MKYLAYLGLAAALLPLASAAQDRPDEKAFLSLYRELVETNTVVGVGSCTRAATQIADRLKAAGYPAGDVSVFTDPAHPDDGGVVAVLKGSDPAVRPMLLLGHIDVVAAKPEDWKRDPFKLVEENGFYYARGTVDDKAMAAVWADAMIRFRQQGYHPRRTIKLALTCGEETTFAFNGAEWLARNRPDAVSAEFALNEGGGGRLTPDGQRQVLAVQVGEKASQNFTFVTTNPGGHSSAPTPANAIYELADAVKAVQGYEFPIRFTGTTRAFFAATAAAPSSPRPLSQAIRRLLANPRDVAADRIVSSDKTLHSTLRTTCVATLLAAGHAENALPQRATANINCRIFPGESVDQTLATLRRLAGPKVTVTANAPIRPVAVPPTLDPKILGPMQAVAARHFPGTPLVPLMSTGATDGIFLEAIGIPTYGAPGIFLEPDLNGIHGLDERIRVKALYEGRDYLFDLVKAYAG